MAAMGTEGASQTCRQAEGTRGGEVGTVSTGKAGRMLRPKSGPQLCQQLAVWRWASHFPSLSLEHLTLQAFALGEWKPAEGKRGCMWEACLLLQQERGDSFLEMPQYRSIM